MQRRLLMVPGPVELEPEVEHSLSRPSTGHLDPDFIRAFGHALGMLREVCRTSAAQPFIVSGSGTLAMELAVANLVEEGDKALVVDTGYFSARMAAVLERHGARVSLVSAALGGAPSVDALKAALASDSYKVLTITHVDTSTGVRAPVEALLRAARASDVLTIVDGVCAAAGEAFEQDAWGADVYLTASQKALGAPPGLALLTVGQRALSAWRRRRSKVRSFYADFAEWLPIMEAYERGTSAYFATPAVGLIYALEASLSIIMKEGVDARVKRHQRIASAFRAAWRALELSPVPLSDDVTANTLSALYYPGQVDASLLARAREEGVVLAGGLHPEIKARTFRVGHMNASREAEVLTTVGAIERALAACGAVRAPGIGLAAAQAVLRETAGG